MIEGIYLFRQIKILLDMLELHHSPYLTVAHNQEILHLQDVHIHEL